MKKIILDAIEAFVPTLGNNIQYVNLEVTEVDEDQTYPFIGAFILTGSDDYESDPQRKTEYVNLYMTDKIAEKTKLESENDYNNRITARQIVMKNFLRKVIRHLRAVKNYSLADFVEWEYGIETANELNLVMASFTLAQNFDLNADC